jgi:hypothetical protein
MTDTSYVSSERASTAANGTGAGTEPPDCMSFFTIFLPYDFILSLAAAGTMSSSISAVERECLHPFLPQKLVMTDSLCMRVSVKCLTMVVASLMVCQRM